MRIQLGLLLGTLILALAAFEGVCRLAGVDFNPNPNWRFHSLLGWTQERSVEYDIRVSGDPVHVEFNSMGFRDLEHSLEKPSGVRRVVVIGDSFSEAIQVNLEETYWHQLQTLLNKNHPQTRWEVINLGVGDFGTAQAWLALTEFGLRYSPDLVVSQIFPLNDICNNTIELAGLCKSQNDYSRPYFVEASDGLELTWAQPVRHRLRSNLVSFGLLEKAYTLVRRQAQGQTVDELHSARIAERQFPGDPLLYTFAQQDDQIEPIATGWRITEKILEDTNSLCRSRGIGWMALVIPFEARVGPGWNNFALSYPDLKMVQDYPEKRLGRLFDRLGAPAVFLKPVFEEHLDVFFPGRGGHLNPAAHALAAQAIHDQLVQSGLDQ